MSRSIGDLVEPGSPLPLLWRDYSSGATSAEIASELLLLYLLSSATQSGLTRGRPLPSVLGGAERAAPTIGPLVHVPRYAAIILRYSPECVEEKFCELRPNGVLRSWRRKLQ